MAYLTIHAPHKHFSEEFLIPELHAGICGMNVYVALTHFVVRVMSVSCSTAAITHLLYRHYYYSLTVLIVLVNDDGSMTTITNKNFVFLQYTMPQHIKKINFCEVVKLMQKKTLLSAQIYTQTEYHHHILPAVCHNPADLFLLFPNERRRKKYSFNTFGT